MDEQKRMKLTNEEIETIINYTNADKTADVYSNNTANINHYLKLAEAYPNEVTIISHDINSITIRVPKKWIKVRPPRQMSEEQRKLAAERLAAWRNKSPEAVLDEDIVNENTIEDIFDDDEGDFSFV